MQCFEALAVDGPKNSQPPSSSWHAFKVAVLALALQSSFNSTMAASGTFPKGQMGKKYLRGMEELAIWIDFRSETC